MAIHVSKDAKRLINTYLVRYNRVLACPGPDAFYYEVIECGRRLFLTGVLIFIAPGSSTQVATACLFALGSLVGFELMRPHVDPANAWLYRLVSQHATSVLRTTAVFVLMNLNR